MSEDIKGMDFDTWRKRYFEVCEGRGHKLRRDGDGDVDQFFSSGGYCNGPGCETCGWTTCMHCQPHFDKIPKCEGT